MYLLRPSDIRKVEDAVLARFDTVVISLDLGLTTITLSIDHGLVIAPDGTEFAMPSLKRDEKTCFLYQDGEFKRIRFTGDETGQVYELAETAGRPMLKVSATPFHKWDFIKRIEEDAARGLIKGTVLDVGTGLGYTAIAAAKTAKRVITVEHDPHIIQLQTINPWSHPLVAENIEQIDGDVCDYIETVEPGSFDTIILDGGTPRSSGYFFSQRNYDGMRQALKRGGTLYHYLPDHGVQHGRDFPGEVISRIKKAGFLDIKRFKEENFIVAR